MSLGQAPTPSPATLAALQRLDAYFAARPRRRWLILTHDNPDPDALASAAVLAQLFKRRYRVSATVGYGGIIGRAENLEMVRALRLRLSRVRHLNWKNYRHFALVDTQPRTGNNQLPAQVVPDVVIDHHPPRKESFKAAFTDIRPAWGATASILAEYLIASAIVPSSAIATALIYAIRTETQDFRREGESADRKLYDYLYPLANKRALGRIQHPNLPLSYFRTLHQALESMQGVDNVILCHLPATPTPDNVPQIADLLLRAESKTWALATGPYEDRIWLALRTTNARADAGRAMRRILGRKGKGGGHGTMAGGWIPLERDVDLSLQQRRLGERLLRILGKDPQRVAPIRLAEPPPPTEAPPPPREEPAAAPVAGGDRRA
ncbi:MAG TPA: DHH family phosphoesterase [Thermoanaerobaculia bacterium]|nr:DHH family phosphoesterase [Thermoanaerobaculia bacterium]